MKTPAALLALVASLVAVLAIAPAVPAAPPSQQAASPLTAPVSGAATDAVGDIVGTVTGVLAITGFTIQDGALAAVGNLTVTVTNAAGDVIGTITQAVTIPLQNAGSCRVLHLELGPLDLDLLGLVVHLDKVVLDITAQSGPGNLLGNLLCTVTHLLDGNASQTAVQNLLNALLRAISRL
jgi:hypothetical protein